MTESPLKAKYVEISEKIDNLSIRERAVVLLTALAIVYMIWDLVLLDPVATLKDTVDKDIASTEQKVSAMLLEEQAILQAVNADPDRDLKQQLSALEKELQDLEETLAQLSLGLVPVEQLAQILYEVLEKTDLLQLENLRTLPVEEIYLVSGEEDKEGSAGVYKHRVALSVKGEYAQLMQYLQQLERLNWRFYWDELIFEEDQYPTALIHLRVYTLSTDEGLFGV